MGVEKDGFMEVEPIDIDVNLEKVSDDYSNGECLMPGDEVILILGRQGDVDE